jgi:hypothetical protein
MVIVEARVLDATHLELAKPISSPAGGTVLVSLAEPADSDTERAAWLAASAQGLDGAYEDSEPEYSADMIREPNPEYGR